ncbi:hypothetical protein EUX98_g2045 [Antrodiella citrinella]|uniref:Uncharacterized protein n=1 Tax=Antrodiella citrinella TaxID=2447956 RepID=A0A4V3XJ94_9APHY|nr:hypothetical protein EUX98_g2045 [Antrodiella citrinella]
MLIREKKAQEARSDTVQPSATPSHGTVHNSNRKRDASNSEESTSGEEGAGDMSKRMRDEHHTEPTSPPNFDEPQAQFITPDPTLNLQPRMPLPSVAIPQPEPLHLSAPDIGLGELAGDVPGGIPDADPGCLQEIQAEEEEEEEAEPEAAMEELKWSQAFIRRLKQATLAKDKFSPEMLYLLQHPETYSDLEEQSPKFRLSLDFYIALGLSSNQTYNKLRASVESCFPNFKMLSLDVLQRRIERITGVVALREDMCPESCLAYVGEFENDEECRICHTSRWDPIKLAESNKKIKVPAQTFDTIPIGPQLQALLRSPESARNARYRVTQTHKIMTELGEMEAQLGDGVLPQIGVYDDVYHGSEYIEAVRRGDIKDDDMVLMMSLDGAQLYEKKQSDCWIYIWIILDHAPDVRYKKKYVLPGGVIPGPKKPKHIDSFLFPGLHHLSALQREGLRMWDANEDRVFTSFPYFHIGAADGPGMSSINGLVGHGGQHGCRMYCGMLGRHQANVSRYFPVALRPLGNYNVLGSTHPDIDLTKLHGLDIKTYQRNLNTVLRAQNDNQYRLSRLHTGIVKPSLFSGLHPWHTTRVPSCFVMDLMHLGLNLADILLDLWRGTLRTNGSDSTQDWEWAVLKGDVWTKHGEAVASATPYLPGSFDRPPRNPAEKINSGYKAWEFLLYLFVLGPAVFRAVLPTKFWVHHCRLVYAMRILLQRSITREQLMDAHKSLLRYCQDFEKLYYKQRPERIHFVRQSIHILIHIAPETIRMGPGCLYTQWTMERLIGDLGAEIRQPSKPFANLARRATRRAQISAMKSIHPELDTEKVSPRGSKDIGDKYTFLTARDEFAQPLRSCELAVFVRFLQDQGENIPLHWKTRIYRWARLELPNGQITRSAWKEKTKALQKLRISRMGKARLLLS